MEPTLITQQSLLSGLTILIIFFVLIYNLRKTSKTTTIKGICKMYGIVGIIYEKYNVHQDEKKRDSVYFELGFPSWKYAKKNGEKDSRHKENKIIWNKSYIYLPKLYVKISCDIPDDMLILVRKFREAGIKIGKCPEERYKYNLLASEFKKNECLCAVNKIYRTYVQSPFEFENFIADIFIRMGYETNITSKTNDGGYDIIAEKAGISTIIECKCYNPEKMVGRPAIQKLVGANQVIHADNIFFCTTCDFTKEAIMYAEDTGVELINGKELEKIVKDSFTNVDNSKDLRQMDWKLTEKDLQKYYPPDIAMELYTL